MVRTSYFACKKWSVKDAVSVAAYMPKGYGGEKYPDLYPPSYLLKDYKDGKVSQSQYASVYRREVLNKLDPKKVYEDLDGKVLLCYEKSGDFCHRNLVAAWLRQNGFEAKEL